jgi:ATP-binding cassette subfamily B protein
VTTTSASGELLGDDDVVIADGLRPRWDALLRDEAAAAGGPLPPQPPAPPLRGFRSLVRPNRGGYAVAAVLLALETLSAQSGPLLTQLVIDRGIAQGRVDVVLGLALAYVAATILSSIATSARLRITGRLGQRTAEQLRRRVFDHVQAQSASYFARERTGRLLTRVTSDVDAVTGMLQDGMVNMIVQCVTLVAVGGALLVIEPVLGAVVLLFFLPAVVLATLWFRRVSTPRFTASRAALAEVVADLQETVSSARAVVASGRTAAVAEHHAQRVAEAETAARAAVAPSAGYSAVVEALAGLGQVVVLVIGGRMVLQGRLSVGELVAFLLYLGSLLAPVQQLVQLYTTYQSGQASMRKLVEVLQEAPAVCDVPGARDLVPGPGEVRLEDVCFSYREDVPVLRHVDLCVAPGERLVLVGPSGSGKSTLARLLPRFVDPTSGRVLLDGQDVRQATQRSLRRRVLLVPQDPLLFAGSVRDNLLLARPEASDEQLREACRRVGADVVVDRLGGLDALLNERGGSLSAGERQLLVLARSALVDSAVLVLDEATSHLDPLSESLVEEGIDGLLRGRTAIVVAHRISTALRADRVAVVHDGRILELGSPQELLARGGAFSALHAAWARKGGSGDVDEVAEVLHRR